MIISKLKKHLNTISKKERLFLLFFVAAAFLFRYYQFHDYQVTYWYDQSRDAYLARQIIEDKDLKIQGPSASGTNETIYHGVFYYYFIAPFYVLSQGDPMLPIMALAILNSITVIPLYFLVKDMFKNKKIATITCLLFTFSYENAQLSTWISNPNLCLLFFTIFYFSIWKIFFRKNSNYLPLLAFALGMNLQAGVWTLYLFGTLISSLIYITYIKKDKIKKYFPLKTSLISVGIFIATISTMIVTQLKLFFAGIFTFEAFAESAAKAHDLDLLVITRTINLILEKMTRSLLPIFPLASFIILLIIINRFIKLQKNNKTFFIIWFTTPFWLTAFHTRYSVYLYTGLELILFIILAIIIAKLLKMKNIFLTGVVIFITSLYILAQFKQTKVYHQTKTNMFMTQRGTFLKDQLSLIDKSYEIADGQPFSISTFTNPLGYNTTWAYLYDWYGKKKYGYKPKFYGPDQTGIFANELMEQTKSPLDIHFAILEPGVTAVSDHLQDFLLKQGIHTTQVKELDFSFIKLQHRIKNHS